MGPFLFVGERPSHQAVKIGATWQNGKLAGRTLRAALIAIGLDPAIQQYMNLYSRPEVGEHDRADEQTAILLIREYQARSWPVVGLGRVVCDVLAREGVPHTAMIHPAARGAIRCRERYQAHVAAVLVK